jgi:hypothetical protein
MEPDLHEAQIQALRRMTQAQRLVVNASLWDHAHTLKRAMIRSLHPDWTKEQIEEAVQKVFQSEHR